MKHDTSNSNTKPINRIASYFTKTVILIGTLLTITNGVIILYQFFHKDMIKIEVKTIDRVELTKIPDIEGLTVNYHYHGNDVENLWKVRYVISNIGARTIIAKTDHRNILSIEKDSDGKIVSETLPIYFKNKGRVLSVVIDEKNFDIEIVEMKDNIVKLDFKQWKRGEFIYITAMIENSSEMKPSLSIDEGDIIDSKIVFSEFNPIEVKEKRGIIDPVFLIVMFTFFFNSIGLIYIWRSFYKSRKFFEKTEKKNE